MRVRLVISNSSVSYVSLFFASTAMMFLPSRFPFPLPSKSPPAHPHKRNHSLTFTPISDHRHATYVSIHFLESTALRSPAAARTRPAPSPDTASDAATSPRPKL
jgi:hypothetical protein